MDNRAKCETCGHYENYPEESEWEDELIETEITEVFIHIYSDNEIEEVYDISTHQNVGYFGANMLFKTLEEAREYHKKMEELGEE